MIYPSIDKLLENVDSKYTLVTIASKRARQMREVSGFLIDKPVAYKHVGTALEEMYAGKIGFERLK
ncbi:DNA-directed RNA polymerase subunit omega [Aneurinibacillus soli]|uniref:DNA-directed RNA polymerase subunit omega n=1 Tax=Aneurinibacillus soli TaxID=1500254 RepID=A0A0U5B9Y2_9BACL|nr:DNA-directed RNA polymerase subunit omega [Aneurinibacillus soli]PYE63534.1 DNA-directed RNA polymerase subunit omega [Aneurinibacillus soli]BAU27533.1 DNA-directed RNA polymerase subunit omega [Aneurinibacillus soli]